jgi:type IV pilus assembly protein PilX
MNNVSLYQKQSGVVLIISLIMLVLLTLIGVTSMQVTGLEEKMAGNMKSNNLAFQSAETALREGETWLANRPSEPAVDSAPVWGFNAMDPNSADSTPWWFDTVRNAAWWDANAVQSTATLRDFPVGNTFKPYNIIEFKYFESDTLVIGTNNPPPGINYYQVTAKGTGTKDNTPDEQGEVEESPQASVTLTSSA